MPFVFHEMMQTAHFYNNDCPDGITLMRFGHLRNERTKLHTLRHSYTSTVLKYISSHGINHRIHKDNLLNIYWRSWRPITKDDDV